MTKATEAQLAMQAALDCITLQSAQVFFNYLEDAPNWSGAPLVGGNVGGSKEERGNLTQLKMVGLIKTQVDEGHTWVYFTPLGIERGREVYGLDPVYGPAKA